jgi:carboxypeptidase Taq
MGVPVSQACLDIYNPGMTNEAVDDTFERLAGGWPRLMRRLREKEKTLPPPLPITQDIPADAQLRLFAKIEEAMLEAAGWDNAALARAGVTIELTTAQTGFSWGSGKNIKLAIETDPRDLLKGLANAMHECGHMLYMLEMNRLPESVQGTPAAQPNGTAKNESAALYFERAGLRREFFALAAPLIQQELGVSGPEWESSNLHRLATRHDLRDTGWGASEAMLAPNMAWRALAERRILDGEMSVGDLPEFWAQTMEEFTGIAHDPAQFIVGEDHWPAGLAGYFHAYQSGAMDAAALHAEIAPNPAASSLQEYLQPYYEHIRDRIFRHGSRESPESLLDAAGYLEKLTGDADPRPSAPPAFTL